MRRLPFFMIGAALAFALTVAPAAAAGLSKAEIAKALSDQGYAVEDFQSNMLIVYVGEQKVLVAIAGPDADVSYITYLEGVTLGSSGHGFLSKFNSEVKFGRAYMDRDGDVAIQMDRNAAGGVTLRNVESDFDVFLLLVAKFLQDLESRGSV